MNEPGGLMQICGGTPATYKEVAAVPLPEQTETYMPVSHIELIQKVIDHTTQIMSMTLDKAGFGMARGGDHMFARLRFRSGQHNNEMRFCVGLVNSYDKRLRVRMGTGANILSCDNLVIAGDITYARKHTIEAWPDINAAIAKNLGGAQSVFDQLVMDADRMKSIQISDDGAYQAMGLLYGRGILRNHMLTVARDQWLKPDHSEFEQRTLWSLYNAINSALKLSRPGEIMEKHRELHKLLGGPRVRFNQSLIMSR